MKSVIFKNKRATLALIWRTMRWHLNYLFIKRPLPLACGLYLTNKCNFKCSFCNIWRKSTPTTLPLATARKIVDNLSSLSCFYFSITGGEPLLVDYLFDLLTYARRSRIKYLHLVTNGFLLDEGKTKALAKTGLNEISISIDGPEKIHDQNRATPGSYNRAIKAIENLKRFAPKIKIVLNAIFSPQEPFDCLHVVELSQRFNIYAKVQPLNQQPLFNSENHSSISYKNLSPEKIREAITKLRSEKRVVNSGVFLDNIYNFFCNKEALVLKDEPCIFGYHHLEISEKGDLFPCLEGLNWKNGLRFDGNLKGILRSAEYKNLLEGLKKCRACQRAYYICYYEPRIAFPINHFLKFL